MRRLGRGGAAIVCASVVTGIAFHAEAIAPSRQPRTVALTAASHGAQLAQTSEAAKKKLEETTIVHFLYTGISDEVAEKIQVALANEGYSIPERGEQESSASSEVRFYNTQDKDRAAIFAVEAEKVIANAHLKPSKVFLRDYTGWKEAKPPIGTIEIYLVLKP